MIATIYRDQVTQEVRILLVATGILAFLGTPIPTKTCSWEPRYLGGP